MKILGLMIILLLAVLFASSFYEHDRYINAAFTVACAVIGNIIGITIARLALHR